MTYVDGSLPGSCLRFEDLVVRKHLQRAVLSGFQVDHNWLMSKLPTSTKICIVRPRFTDLPEGATNCVISEYVYCAFPKMPASGYGCMHVKFLLLFYPGFLRFVVTSANLVDYDWEQQENVIWVQDFPIPEEDSHPPPSDFSKDLEEILSAMEVPANVRLAVMKADFSSAKAKLCFSRPGSFSGSSLLTYGHLRLSEIVKELAIPSLERHQETMVTYQTSSLGALSPSWIKEFHRSACGKRPASTEADAIPPTEILFPSSATVAKSKLGPNGAGTICFARKAWERPDFPQQVLRNSVSKRPGTLSHSKIILVAPSSPNSTPGAGNDEIVGWYYCGSHNSTQSAWGALWRSKRKVKQNASVANDDELAGCTLRIRNWELGVVFPMTRNRKSAINGGFDLVVPFQYPAASYAQDDTPWFK
ncbi:tyrosyl-DNA phosphodiesterase I [Powellomyces hirtus]|nr:tyrosyl-DNA phosphodiesterase I [Powellomyces hirtus]